MTAVERDLCDQRDEALTRIDELEAEVERLEGERHRLILTLHEANNQRDAANAEVSGVREELTRQVADNEDLSATTRIQRSQVGRLRENVSRLNKLRDQWQEVTAAESFDEAVNLEAHHYHDSACSYKTALDATRTKLADALVKVAEVKSIRDRMEATEEALVSLLADLTELADDHERHWNYDGANELRALAAKYAPDTTTEEKP